jgi:hypothetical protein
MSIFLNVFIASNKYYAMDTNLIFIDNKYTKWYYSIIQNAQVRNAVGYKESHHILPKSLGGTNKKDNIVKLMPNPKHKKYTKNSNHYTLLFDKHYNI